MIAAEFLLRFSRMRSNDFVSNRNLDLVWDDENIHVGIICRVTLAEHGTV